MNVMIDFCLVPLGVGVSVSPYIAKVQEILGESGLTFKMHAYGTNVEGEWEKVFATVKRCHEEVHKMGAPRITTSMRFGTRTDKEQSMTDKINSVANKLVD